MFESIEVAPLDPILGLNEAFANECNPEKINLGVGVYKDESGNIPVLRCVQKAAELLKANQTAGGYLPITGCPEFNAMVVRLILGEEISEHRAIAAQTPGGTGALRVAGDFIKRQFPDAKIWFSDPTWANHKGIFTAAGFELESYPYYDKDNHALAVDEMMATLQKVPQGDVVLFHACCHNPSGMDPLPEHWEALAEIVRTRGILPLFDFAYQGFGKGIEEDATGIRTFAAAGIDLLVASSFSKNFGLYNQRVGGLTVVAGNADAAKASMSQIKQCIRTTYSNPPAYGAQLVANVLGDPELRRVWTEEVTEMRERIHALRREFAETMASHTDKRDFGFITKQLGMFSFSGLSKEQVARLRKEHAIYIVDSGRISVAGMSSEKMSHVCEAVASVL